MENLEKMVEVMNKVSRNLGGGYYTITKKENVKCKSEGYKAVYYTQKQFINLYKMYESFNFCGVQI